MRRLPGTLALLVLLPAGPSWARDPAALAGNWLALWPNNTRNSMSLTYTGRGFTGTYVSDDGERCPVGGNADPRTANVAFQVQCRSWSVRMEGAVSADGRTITGTYRAYVNASGDFTMVRR